MFSCFRDADDVEFLDVCYLSYPEDHLHLHLNHPWRGYLRVEDPVLEGWSRMASAPITGCGQRRMQALPKTNEPLIIQSAVGMDMPSRELLHEAWDDMRRLIIVAVERALWIGSH
jgi:hypothetical protein